jgi:TetR/AcrR family transcriptional repressor of nem operon
LERTFKTATVRGVATKRFDPEVALDRALDAFWAGGYEGTSAQDLVDAMGINRGSLYDTFGSKHALYRRALERYGADTGAQLEAALDGDGPVPETIRSALLAQAEALTDDPAARGCLLVNACTERAGRDEVIGDVVRTAFDATRGVLAEALARGQRRGEVTDALPAATLADFLVTTMQGLRVAGKEHGDRARLAASIDVALAALRPAT